MLFGARLFITVIYTLIGLSFWAVTATLIYEFRGLDWFTIATFYSHLFIFFPIFGTVALFAFYRPSVVFLDMYWRYVPLGRPRFVAGLLVVAVLSYVEAQQLTKGPQRSLFEIPPQALLADHGFPDGCDHDIRPAGG